MEERQVWVKMKDNGCYPWRAGKVLSRGEWIEFQPQEEPISVHEALEIQDRSDEGNVDNLAALTHLNEPAVVSCLYNRFQLGYIYTYTGSVLLAVNPCREIPSLYDWAKHSSDSPHVYTTAARAYTSMMQLTMNQTILVSGESGAGKTESVKHIMKYLVHLSASERDKSNPMLESNTILESFGNAATLRNDNSSRFGKFIKIYFSNVGKISQTRIETYLLERVRVTEQTPGERNYHVFYELLEGADVVLKRRLGLTTAQDFRYTAGGCAKCDDPSQFLKTMSALKAVGFSQEEQDCILQVLASILHLGNIEFFQEHDSCRVENETLVSVVAELLQLDPNELSGLLTSKKVYVRGDSYQVELTIEQAVEFREALARSIYGQLFDWIVRRLNGTITDCLDNFIGVLDIFGFEAFETNSFEQLCINYANECLQNQFSAVMITEQQQEYEREKILWEHIEYQDTTACQSLLDSRLGIFTLLDEECLVPKGGDASFARKMYAACEGHEAFEAPPKLQTELKFAVKHFADTVIYSVSSFCVKNKDKLDQEATDLLRDSKSEIIATFPGSVKLHRSDSTGRRSTIASIGIGSQFKKQLGILLESIRKTTPLYIRCLKPNEKLLHDVFDRSCIAQQLQYGGVFEVIRLSRSGYASRFEYPNFYQRYGLLKATHQLVQTILKQNASNEVLVAKGVQLGLSKVFLKRNVYEELEKLRQSLQNTHVVVIQCRLRGFYHRRVFLKLRRAIIQLQICHRRHALKAKRASIVIQSILRGKLIRMRISQSHRAASVIQAMMRKKYQVQTKHSIDEEKVAMQLRLLELEQKVIRQRERADRAEMELMRLTKEELPMALPLSRRSICSSPEPIVLISKPKAHSGIIRSPVKRTKLSLHGAASEGRVDIVEQLLRDGHDLLTTDRQGRTALHVTWNIDIMDILINLGANVNAMDLTGRTPLHYAVEMRNPDAVAFLVSKNARVEATEYSKNYTPLHIAVQTGQKEIVGIFCRPDVFQPELLNKPDRDGNTLLHLVAVSTHRDAVYLAELLLALGANPNIQDATGSTPLHVSVIHRSALEIVERLVHYGASVDRRNFAQKTALHLAAERGSFVYAELLVQLGANMNLPDGSGQMVCQSEMASKLVKILPRDHQAEWIRDSQVNDCMICHETFSFFTRRHHCRRCGRICCGSCSTGSPEKKCRDCLK